MVDFRASCQRPGCLDQFLYHPQSQPHLKAGTNLGNELSFSHWGATRKTQWCAHLSGQSFQPVLITGPPEFVTISMDKVQSYPPCAESGSSIEIPLQALGYHLFLSRSCCHMWLIISSQSGLFFLCHCTIHHITFHICHIMKKEGVRWICLSLDNIQYAYMWIALIYFHNITVFNRVNILLFVSI